MKLPLKVQSYPQYVHVASTVLAVIRNGKFAEWIWKFIMVLYVGSSVGNEKRGSYDFIGNIF